MSSRDLDAENRVAARRVGDLRAPHPAAGEINISS
jgi:hypothetical protein